MSTNPEIIYWGVVCRKCSEPVAFGAPSHQQFEQASSYAKPGAICCANGHNYIYFPRDFRFFGSAVAIPEAVMLAHREAHRAVNPAVVRPTDHRYGGTRWSPQEAHEADRCADEAKGAKPPCASYGPDPRREMAQATGKAHWAEWAIKKVS